MAALVPPLSLWGAHPCSKRECGCVSSTRPELTAIALALETCPDHRLAGAPPAPYAFWRATCFLLKHVASQGNSCLDIYGVIKRTPSLLAIQIKNTVPAQLALGVRRAEWVDTHPGGSNRCSQLPLNLPNVLPISIAQKML